jgi:hypothetical protein
MATTHSGTQGMTGTSGGMRMGTQGGVSNDTYNLISVMYHCLQGCETYQRYADDAQQAGNQELAQFFRETMQEEQQRAQRGERLLMQCLQKEQGGGSQMHSQGSAQGQHMASGSQGQGQMQGQSSSGSQQQQSDLSRSQQGSSQSGSSSAQSQSSNESSSRSRGSR